MSAQVMTPIEWLTEFYTKWGAENKTDLPEKRKYRTSR